MQHRARATIYWPGIDADIVEYFKRCKTCTQHKATQHIQPLLPRDVPEAPWQDLAADFFNFKGKEYLLIADTFSKYPFASRMTTKTAETESYESLHNSSHSMATLRVLQQTMDHHSPQKFSLSS